MSGLQVNPNEALRGARPYSSPKPAHTIDLWLDANEGPTPPFDLLRAAESVQTVRRYPSTDDVRALLAGRLGVACEQVAVTAGGDDAIDRACRSVLAPGKEIILTPPTFEMFHRYAAVTGASAVEVEWTQEPFPLERVMSAITDRTAAIAVVSPNNPTGLVVRADDLRTLAKAAPRALIIADLAYTEFADVDLQPVALEFPNVVSIRTLSKAWGAAGLRVGYAVGHPDVVTWIRAAGGPYAVSGPAALVACRMLETCAGLMQDYVARVRIERHELFGLLESLGATPWTSQANFVTASFKNAAGVHEQLASRGIAVRYFGPRPLVSDCLRITCPGSVAGMGRLSRALKEILA
ncbi:MAG: histidinol-phosphate transaminase [Planctomycetota bacterium]